MLQFYQKLMLYGLLIELFLQISCSANSKTNSIINKPQFDVDGHAHNETEVIKRSTKLNLSENLSDEIKLEFDSNTSTHDGCNFNETLLNVEKLVYFSNIDADQEKAESNKLRFEPDAPLLPEEFMFRNGKKCRVDEDFQKIHHNFYATSFIENDAYDEDGEEEDLDELSYGKPIHEDLVTWVNKEYIYKYWFPRASNPRTVNECKNTLT